MSNRTHDDVDCPRCGHEELISERKWTIQTCLGCGRVFLDAGEPHEWEVVGHLDR